MPDAALASEAVERKAVVRSNIFVLVWVLGVAGRCALMCAWISVRLLHVRLIARARATGLGLYFGGPATLSSLRAVAMCTHL